MAQHTHNFVENYTGLVGFGLNRDIDENTVIYYLQKFSDDTLLKQLITRLSDEELDEIFSLITRLMNKHLTETEYHKLFLKDNHPK
ncbi:MAG: cytoplasmic protein [Deltaproteobacteria bacterium]|nr:MAG: cytoplasmic protein [Deltaproteobacteria bacterium]